MKPMVFASGDAVVLDNKIIPAMNIQVEDIPEGYDIYFEIMFEDGSLWVVDCEIKGEQPHILEYPAWYLFYDDMTPEESRAVFNKNLEMSTQCDPANWEEFMELYKKKVFNSMSGSGVAERMD